MCGMCNGDLMFKIACMHRDINMSPNKTDFCIQLHLNHSVKVGKLALLLQMVCLLHQLYSVLRHNEKQ